jgi:hypothetical protein
LAAQQPMIYANRRRCTWMYETRNETNPDPFVPVTDACLTKLGYTALVSAGRLRLPASIRNLALYLLRYRDSGRSLPGKVTKRAFLSSWLRELRRTE